MEGLALSLRKARRPNEDRCISAGFASRVFDLNRRAEATNGHDRKANQLPTSNEGNKNLEQAPLSLWLSEPPTQRGRLY
jgi:hypothetical protein